MNGAGMRFSIITITFNSKKYLEQTILSVLHQDYQEFEYLLIDGGSTDGTLEILKRYADEDPRIRWISEPDKGISDAMNKGILIAEGDIIAHLHSDDYYLQGALGSVVQLFEKGPQTSWVTGKARFVNHSDETIYETSLKESYSFNSLYKKNIICHPSTFIRREIFNDIGLFDINIKYAMDYDIYLRILQKYELTVIDEVLVSYRSHLESLSSSNLIYAIQEELGISKKYKFDVPFPLVIARYINYYRELLMIRFGMNNLIKRIKYKFIS
jgi:glycosyltransferase involved in cell wall biosynthesis